MSDTSNPWATPAAAPADSGNAWLQTEAVAPAPAGEIPPEPAGAANPWGTPPSTDGT